MAAIRPERSAAKHRRPAINLQKKLFPGREKSPESASTFSVVTTEDLLQAWIDLSGRRRRDHRSSMFPLPPPRWHEEIGGRKVLILRSGRPATGLLIELPIDPLTFFHLHQGEEAAEEDFDDHRVPPVDFDGKLPHGKRPRKRSKHTTTANRSSLSLITGHRGRRRRERERPARGAE
jgi:hypothetical protein